MKPTTKSESMPATDEDIIEFLTMQTPRRSWSREDIVVDDEAREGPTEDPPAATVELGAGAA